MCLAVPSKIIELKKDYMGTVDMEGVKMDVSLQLVPEAKVGDYVIIHVGLALSIIDPQEAKKSLEFFNEIR